MLGANLRTSEYQGCSIPPRPQITPSPLQKSLPITVVLHHVLKAPWVAQILRISGYIADEKEHIARQYLEPATRKESGIPEGSSSLTDAALRTLITEYCRSSC